MSDMPRPPGEHLVPGLGIPMTDLVSGIYMTPIGDFGGTTNLLAIGHHPEQTMIAAYRAYNKQYGEESYDSLPMRQVWVEFIPDSDSIWRIKRCPQGTGTPVTILET